MRRFFYARPLPAADDENSVSLTVPALATVCRRQNYWLVSALPEAGCLLIQLLKTI